ncbi:mitochondrial import inner membrane translocase subunit TIM22 [Epithele typhae]|uniref:mitochondrial import inner membrane translocase subunit TIM22 n=1 Tax=Epithele typhae TaxID=378194 RepID=UPI0020077282|nr:mitochondrial import inner membrane translocase subunit TIM22 [Epithele typhae]KAH9942178.1 mitochondrial import inner membrane translocase subunit TIM22 [Epithele typhae]
MSMPLVAPVFPEGKAPLPPGVSEEERQAFFEAQKYQKWMTVGMESCVAKAVMGTAAGFAMGGFFSLMNSAFQYEDPLLRSNLSASQKAREVFAEMGRGVYRQGKGFAKVAGLFAGIECAVESYRAKNDIYNSLGAGFLTGGVLARNSGPRAAVGGGIAFAAFSGAIDLFLRRETSDED